jgi:hypothetical protein
MDVVAAALAAKQKTALSGQRGQHHTALTYFSTLALRLF